MFKLLQRSLLLAFVVSVTATAPRCPAQSSVQPQQVAVSSVSSWPTDTLLHHGDRLRVTTFDMPGTSFPCKLKSVTADQLVCGKLRDRQMVAFDRKSVQSIVLEGHSKHKASLLFYASAAGLLIGGLACSAAGESIVCASVLVASIAAFVGGQVADHEERVTGPTDPKTIYIAPANSTPAVASASPAVVSVGTVPEAAWESQQNYLVER